MIYRKLQAYKDNEVNTAGKIKLVLLMYDGAIRFLKETKKKMKENDIAGRGLYITKAQKIIGELQGSLNRQRGGDVARQLEEVYSLLMSKLIHANINGDEEVIDQSILILENLRLAWDEVKSEGINSVTPQDETKVALNL